MEKDEAEAVVDRLAELILAINEANFVIASAEALTGDDEVRNRIIGEALFLRGGSDAARIAFGVGGLEVEVVEQHVVGVPRVPVLGEVLDPSLGVEPEHEAVDVAVRLAAQGRRVLGVLAHHVVAVGEHDDVGEPVGRQVVRVDARARVRLARPAEDAADRLDAPMLGLAHVAGQQRQPVPPHGVVGEKGGPVELAARLEHGVDGLDVAPLGIAVGRHRPPGSPFSRFTIGYVSIIRLPQSGRAESLDGA